MEDYESYILPILIIMIAAAYKKKMQSKRRKRSCWTRPWIQRRGQLGAHHALLEELSSEDSNAYRNFVRMKRDEFEDILRRVSPLIKRQDTLMRAAITPAERLSLTLRYLATGDSYKSISFLYRIPECTLSQIIPETCVAIYRCLKDEYMKVPNTEDEWTAIAKEFNDKWNFPNCLGAMDGKHIAIQCPNKSGSKYFNYKQFFSIVLFALVDADYKFLYVDCGCNGRISDGGVFANSSLFRALENKSLNIPGEKILPGRHHEMPHVIVGDDAFPLKSYIMKPYPLKNLDIYKRIFNYRLSRARRIVENVFGILSCRFRVLRHVIPLEPGKVESIVLACCALHNYLRTKQSGTSVYLNRDLIDVESPELHTVTPGAWRRDRANHLPGLQRQSGNYSSNEVREIRDEYCDYFNTNGQVPWQWDMI